MQAGSAPLGERAVVALERESRPLLGLGALVLLAPAALIYLSFSAGGYFPSATGIVAVVFALALILRSTLAGRPFEGFSRTLAIPLLALVLYAAWQLTSTLWSHATAASLDSYDRTLLYVLAFCAVRLAALHPTAYALAAQGAGRWNGRGVPNRPDLSRPPARVADREQLLQRPAELSTDVLERGGHARDHGADPRLPPQRRSRRALERAGPGCRTAASDCGDPVAHLLARRDGGRDRRPARVLPADTPAHPSRHAARDSTAHRDRAALGVGRHTAGQQQTHERRGRRPGTPRGGRGRSVHAGRGATARGAAASRPRPREPARRAQPPTSRRTCRDRRSGRRDRLAVALALGAAGFAQREYDKFVQRERRGRHERRPANDSPTRPTTAACRCGRQRCTSTTHRSCTAPAPAPTSSTTPATAQNGSTSSTPTRCTCRAWPSSGSSASC